MSDDSFFNPLRPRSATNPFPGLGQMLGTTHGGDGAMITVATDLELAGLRPSEEWGRVLRATGALEHCLKQIPPHIKVRITLIPEGVAVCAVCRCGGRSEVLVDQRPFDAPIEPATLTSDAASLDAASAAAREVAAAWVPSHVKCASDFALIEVPTVLASGVMQHAAYSAHRLYSGKAVPNYLALVMRDSTGIISQVAPLDDVPETIPAESEVSRQWMALRHFNFRGAAREPGITPMAAVAVAISVRCLPLQGGELPLAEIMMRDSEAEWQVTVRGVTTKFGIELTTPWAKRRAMRPDGTGFKMGPLTDHCDLVDGVLARTLRARS